MFGVHLSVFVESRVHCVQLFNSCFGVVPAFEPARSIRGMGERSSWALHPHQNGAHYFFIISNTLLGLRGMNLLQNMRAYTSFTGSKRIRCALWLAWLWRTWEGLIIVKTVCEQPCSQSWRQRLMIRWKLDQYVKVTVVYGMAKRHWSTEGGKRGTWAVE